MNHTREGRDNQPNKDRAEPPTPEGQGGTINPRRTGRDNEPKMGDGEFGVKGKCSNS